MRFFINDVGLSLAQFHSLEKFGRVLSAAMMTENIVNWENWEHFDVERTMLVFPGNGANIVRRHLPNKWLCKWHWTTIKAKRIWIPGENPSAFVDRICSDCFILGIRDIVIIDDVISSGSTVKKIIQINDPWIPNAKWHVVSWVRQRAVNLRQFKSSYAAEIVGETSRRASINSMSTLLVNDDIAREFAKRHFSKPQEFIDQLIKLQ